MPTPIQPLGKQFPIVNKDGTPTEYFTRWAQQRQVDINQGITAAEAQALIDDWAADRDIIAGFGLSGGGNLASDVTINLDAELGDLSDVDLITTPPADGDALTYDLASDTWIPGAGGGGGGGGSLQKISEVVVGSPQANVTFSSITNAYRDLIVVVNSRGTTAATFTTLRVQLNGDTGANYAWAPADSNGAAGTSFVGSYGDTSWYVGATTAATAPANINGGAEFVIYGYSQTVATKSFDGWHNAVIAANVTGTNRGQTGGQWNNTAAVTSVKIFPTAGNFAAGTVVTLYGRGGSSGVPGGVITQDEGITVETNTGTLNFKGSGVSATSAGAGVVDVTIAGGGTVSSIAASGGTSGLGVSGGPITTSGTLLITGTIPHKKGLRISSAGSINNFTVTPGQASDTTLVSAMKLTSTYTKTNAAWAVGSGNGGLLSGTIAANTWYHIWEIQRLDTGVVDIGFDIYTNATPTLPTNYTVYKRIGSIKTNPATTTFRPFRMMDDHTFRWDAHFAYDVNATPPPAVATGYALLSIPLGIVVRATILGAVNTITGTLVGLVTDGNKPTPVNAGAQANIAGDVAAAAFQAEVWTTSAAQIYILTNTGNYFISVEGWTDPMED